jgi:hypothetical protein
MEQREKSASHSGGFNFEKRSSNTHQTEGCMNLREYPKMVMKRKTLSLPETECQPQPMT